MADPGKHLEFHLARELGMTVAELRERMSHRELVEWSAFLGLEDQHRELAEKQARHGR